MLVFGQGVGDGQHEQAAVQVGQGLLQGDVADVEAVAQHHHQHHAQHQQQGQPGAAPADGRGKGGQPLLAV